MEMNSMQRKTISIDGTKITKRDGSLVPFDIEKIHKMVEIACDNLTGVSVSDIEMAAHLSFFDGVPSLNIHRALIKAAANLISEATPNYQYVAGRLLNFDMRKGAWGGMHPPRLFNHITNMIELGFYTPDLLSTYTEEEWDHMDSIMDHDRDLKMTYIGTKEYMTKYAVRDRAESDVLPLETPQFTYILISALMCSDTKAFKDIKSYYNDVSMGNVSLPTPIMAGMRTHVKQFSSCVLVECGDTLNSIGKSTTAIQKYIAKKAGIGVSYSAIRAEGASVANGSVKHTGVIPFIREVQGTVKSCCLRPDMYVEILDE